MIPSATYPSESEKAFAPKAGVDFQDFEKLETLLQ